ncbi:CHAT domain-containing protein [Leptolyngbya sp. NIES-2104]|uniref:CHAT domain-containing protein n=1 Tax=Leptolyngbya sp. NIES-2104 TaxID=1552121 RepID=UPI0006ECAF98|nr:CHAT domain-containing protein [Leptolyngbya sp. NIES-2104]GAP94722.1 TPR repeat [Leptolyngbya sp. NIES-2104]
MKRITRLKYWLKSRFAKLCLLVLACSLIVVFQPMIATASVRSQAIQLYEAGRFQAAIALWQQSIRTYEQQNDRVNQALSLNYLALAWQELGDLKQANQAISESLELLDRTNNSSVRARALNTQGKLFLALGQPEKATSAWQAAEVAYRQSGDELGAIGSQINQAQALQTQGLLRRSQLILESVTQQLQKQPASSLKLAAVRNLGIVWQVTGQFDKAKTTLEKSVEIAKQLNDREEVSVSLFNLANVLRSMGELDSALKQYAEAAKLASLPQTRLGIQVNQFSTLLKLQNWQQAREVFEQSKLELKNLSPSRQSIYARVNLSNHAMKNLQQFSNQEIAEELAIAVQDARTIQDFRGESYAIGQLGQLYEQTQQLQDAQKLTEQALSLSYRIDASDIAYRWQWQLGRLFRQQGDREKAISAYQESVRLLKSLRADLVATSPDVQFSFREAVEPVYREFVSLLVDQPNQKDLQTARETIEALQLAELENFLRSACLEAKTTQIDQIDASAAVIYPIILPDRLTVIASLPGRSLSVHHTKLPKDDVEKTLEKMLESLNPVYPDEERLQISQQIYQWLIQPIAQELEQNQIKTLTFVLDGTLRNIPITALYDGEHYLIEKYSVAITPGLQLVEPRSLSQSQRLNALVGGITEERQGFSSLPGVAREATQIASKLNTQIFLDRKFTKQNLQESIQETQFPLIHLATHGQFSSKLSDTFLLMWDDRLTIEGLRNLLKSRSNKTPIELLVLSACDTAEGDQRATLGLAGLAVRSGARSTLATLWAVNDNSTAELMTEFYRSLSQQNMSKAESLRQAQLKLLKDPSYQHPYYWSPFILIGNWL